MTLFLVLLTIGGLAACVYQQLRYSDLVSKHEVAVTGWLKTRETLAEIGHLGSREVRVNGVYLGTVDDLALFYVERQRAMQPKGEVN